MDYTAEIQKIEKSNQEAKIQVAKLEQKLEQLNEEETQILKDLADQNITIENLENTIKNLSVDIEETIEEYKEVLNNA